MDDSDDDYVDDYAPPSNAVPRQRPVRRAALSVKSNGGSTATGAVGYSWEEEYHRSWEAVQEDAGGSLAGAIAGMVDSAKRGRILRDTKPVQRGIIRNMVLIIDMSIAMADTDMRPTRLQQTLAHADEFVSEYFSQNPISQLAVVGIRDGLAQMISPLDGNPQTHLDNLAKIRKIEPVGTPSLENALEMARAVLYHVPQHCTREVLLVFGSLMSNDPGDINKTIENLIAERIRVRVIGLAAQVAVCQLICTKTNFGDTSTYNVVLNNQHFKQLVMAVTTPLSINQVMARDASTLVEMGFPSRSTTKSAVLCACHSKLSRQGYSCPRCAVRVCTLPMVCPCCNLTLILSTHLARSYHHLFPLENFIQLDPKECAPQELVSECFACRVEFEKLHHQYKCSKCSNSFCVDCDVFCHETLHNCPGCELL